VKISIITVCYNSAQTIERTIQSVESQTYRNIQYIVVDGGSNDNTIEIINKHRRVISDFVSEPDRGLYDAMNKGIKIATGDLIGILNSDDTFFSANTISEIVKFHELNDIDASVGNIVQCNKKGNIIRFYTSKNWVPDKLKIGFMPPHPSIFFKRELFSLYGIYNLGFTIGADYELITRYFLKYKISWKYSGITTTSMLLGGKSSSGFSSYKIITKEISMALLYNSVQHSFFNLKLRFIWKIVGYFKAKQVKSSINY
jgi:glycosyltransferase involved in cell wall biosynthesis